MKTHLFCLIFFILFSVGALAQSSPLDDNIEDVIQSEITLDEDIDENDITVISHQGVVKLEGEVDSIEAKNRIIDIAKSAAGVNKVDASQLTVFPY